MTKSNCLIAQRVPGPCHSCRGPVEAAHIVSGKDGLAQILCRECCPEHGSKRKAMGAAGSDGKEERQA